MSIISIDFDGTVVTHEYPKVGKEIGAEKVLKRLIIHGHDLVLNTMRSGDELEDAKKWLKNRNIKMVGYNESPGQKAWTTSSKTYAQLYIDDAALGCPLKEDKNLSNRPFVDWQEVEKWLEKNNWL
jgi:hypothetical protein